VFIVRVFATALVSVSLFFFLFFRPSPNFSHPLFLLIQHTPVSTDRRCGICEVDESNEWHKGKVLEGEHLCSRCGNWERREMKAKEKEMKKKGLKGSALEEFEKNWRTKYTEERETRKEKQKNKRAAAVNKVDKWRTRLKELLSLFLKGRKNDDESANNNATETKGYGSSEALAYAENEVPFTALVGIQARWHGMTEDERKAEVERLSECTSFQKVDVKDVGSAGVTVCVDFFLFQLMMAKQYLSVDERNPVSDKLFRGAFHALYANSTIVSYLEKFMEKVTSGEGLFSGTYTREEVFSMFGIEDQEAAQKELNDKRESRASRYKEKQNEEVTCAAGEDCVHKGGASSKGVTLTHPDTGAKWHLTCVKVRCSKCEFQGSASQSWYDANRVRQQSGKELFRGKNLQCSKCSLITCGCSECSKDGGINAVQKPATCTWLNADNFSRASNYDQTENPLVYAGHVTIKCTCQECSANNGANALEKPATCTWLNADNFSRASNYDQTENPLVYAGHVTIKCTCQECSANNGANALEKPATFKWLNADDLSKPCNYDQTENPLVYAGHVMIKCTCQECSANNGANALEKPATYTWLNADNFSVARNYDQTENPLVYAGHVDRKCARCHENGTALNTKKEHKSYPGGFLCNKCKVYEAFDDPRGCGVCCNHLYGYKLTLPEMEKILEHDGALKQLGELTFPPNASPLDRDVCGVCWELLRERLGDMAERERKAAYKEMILKSGNTHEERVEFAKQRLEYHIKKIKESLDAFRAACGSGSKRWSLKAQGATGSGK